MVSKLKIHVFDLNKHCVSGLDGVKIDSNLLNSLFNSTDCDLSVNYRDADFIFVPNNLSVIIKRLGLIKFHELFNSSQVFHQYYWKFLFYYPEENAWSYPLGGTWLRTSVDKTDNEYQSISLPYFKPNQDFHPPTTSKYKINFIGAIHTHPVREKLLANIISSENINDSIFLLMRHQFYWDEMGEHIRKKQIKQMYDAILRTGTTLCPRGTGMNSIRFFEAMSFGRAPILVSENCVLPFEDIIPYDDFIYRLNPEDEFSAILAIKHHELEEKCRVAHDFHKKFLDPKSFSNLLAKYLVEFRDEIYNNRKSEGPFPFEITPSSLFDYFFRYIERYNSSGELMNALTGVRMLKELTDEKLELKKLDNLDNNITFAINEVKLRNLRKYIDYINNKYFDIWNVHNQ